MKNLIAVGMLLWVQANALCGERLLADGEVVCDWILPGSYSYVLPSDVSGEIRYLVVGGGGAGATGGGYGGCGGTVRAGALKLRGGETVHLTVGAGGVGHPVYGMTGSAGERSMLSAGETEVIAAGGGAGSPRAGRRFVQTKIDGADGVLNDISGEPRWYGGGGGSAGYDATGKGKMVVPPGLGGKGGGGSGGKAEVPYADAQPGVDGLGGGGGANVFVYGIAGSSFHGNGAKGGSGAVILRFRSKSVSPKTTPAEAAVEAGRLAFARVFADHAVLQRDQPLTIWGQATSGASVRVSFANGHETRRASTAADVSGGWQARLDPLQASATPGELTVEDDSGHRKTLSDILVGDVWLADGQSNMDMQLWQSQMVDGLAYTNAANDVTLRSMRVERVNRIQSASDLPDNVKIGHAWDLVRNRYSAQSAIAFHFLRQLRAKGVTVPLGCIVTSYGGTTVKMHRLNGGCFQSMVAPLTRLAVSGVIWFQGESDAQNTHYAEDFAAMVGEWRTAFGRELPFYWVQVSYCGRTAFSAEDASSVDALALVREQQRLALDLVLHGGLAVSFDVSAAGNVHFPVKAPVGERLAALALRDVYGLTSVAEGPHVEGAVREGGTVRVRFRPKTCGSGLQVMKKGVDNMSATPSDEPLQGFALSADGEKWFFADSRIDRDEVVVSCDAVPEPHFVRYATMTVPVGHANLYNLEGFPAVPFAAQTVK